MLLKRVKESKWEYCSVSKFDITNSNIMNVFAAGLWSSGTSDALPGRQYRQMLLLYIPMKFIHVYCMERDQSFPSWNLIEIILSVARCKM